MITILGAGLAGISCSYHLGHVNCRIFEKESYPYGHLKSFYRNGFTWDRGPHVSFTKHEYVRDLFAKNVSGNFEEYQAFTSNYYKGHWIDHPAQSNLYQVPEPLRTHVLSDFLASRPQNELPVNEPTDYRQWLELAFGKLFTETFPAAYTRKYWTVDPVELAPEWVGGRVFKPNVEDVIAGSQGPLDRQTHYVQQVRYPSRGGYEEFVKTLAEEAHIEYGREIISIDLAPKTFWTADGSSHTWEKLINTLPLPVFVSLCKGAPQSVIDASRRLACSSLLLVNVTAPHPTRKKYNWMYIYDEEKYCTRIHFTEKLSPNNAPEGYTGIQVEVYASRFKPLQASPKIIEQKVKIELAEMGLIDDPNEASSNIKWCPWANVIFTKETAEALDVIWNWLERYGLRRESDDCHPLTDWNKKETQSLGSIGFAGRFGQWKYFWTDDCVMRGSKIII